MALNLDPKKGEEAAEILVSFLNGPATEVIMEGFQVSRGIGEDNPCAENVEAQFRDYEAWFNDQVMPAANRLKANFEGFAELAEKFNRLSFAGPKQVEDVGQVQSASYDAASDL